MLRGWERYVGFVLTRVSLIVLCAALGLPAVTQAATISVSRRCYAEGDRLVVRGKGFAPRAAVGFTLDGRPFGSANANLKGALEARGRAPRIVGERKRVTLIATDSLHPRSSARTTFSVSELAVEISPRSGGAADRFVTIRARGFRARRTLYAHYVNPRGKVVKTTALGRLLTPCGSLSARSRLIPLDGARPGGWRIQFDMRERFSRRAQPRVVLRVRVAA